jgi:hypothetical protein
MKISEEENQKALSIVAQYNRENENVDKESYKKPLQDFFPKAVNELIYFINEEHNLGITLTMPIRDFILLDIDWQSIRDKKNKKEVAKSLLEKILDKINSIDKKI